MSERDAVIFSYVFHIEEEEYSKKWYESTFQTHLEVMDIGCVLRTQLTFHPNFFGIVLSSSTCGSVPQASSFIQLLRNKVHLLPLTTWGRSHNQ